MTLYSFPVSNCAGSCCLPSGDECCPASSEACSACPTVFGDIVIEPTGCACNFVKLTNIPFVPTWGIANYPDQCAWVSTGLSVEDECGYDCPGTPFIDLSLDAFCIPFIDSCKFCIQAAGGTAGADCPCVSIDLEACKTVPVGYSGSPCMPTGIYTGILIISRGANPAVSGCDIADPCFVESPVTITISA